MASTLSEELRGLLKDANESVRLNEREMHRLLKALAEVGGRAADELDRYEAEKAAVLAMLNPIIESNKGQIGTHFKDCWLFHHGCLALATAVALGVEHD